MMVKRLIVPLSVLLAAALACTAPAGGPPATATPAAPATDTPVPAPLETATPTLTASPSVPVVSVSTATNCRTGPSTDFSIIITLNPGILAELVGKNTGLNYWIIKVPGGGGECWLWGQYASTQGNVAALPEYLPPPTPTPSAPLAVTDLDADVTCDLESSGGGGGLLFFYNEVHVELTWTDVATNEEGYRVYRDGDLVYTLDPNETGVEDDTTLAAIYIVDAGPPTVTYAVRAFNAAGQSDKKEIVLDCVD
jgi:hypothetical protein